MDNASTVESSDQELLRLQNDLKAAREKNEVDDANDALDSLFKLYVRLSRWPEAERCAAELAASCNEDTLFEPMEGQAKVHHAILRGASDDSARARALENASQFLKLLQAEPPETRDVYQIATLESDFRLLKARGGQSGPAEKELLALMEAYEKDAELGDYYRALTRPVFLEALLRIAEERPDPPPSLSTKGCLPRPRSS